MQCLRCGEALRELDGPEGIRFFRCAPCKRDYALRPGGNLVDRWLSPISLVLYPIIYSTRPQDDVERVVRMLRTPCEEDRDDLDEESEEDHRAKVATIVSDIRAELARPTQRVRDILELQSDEQVVTEADVREFLREVADRLEPTSLSKR